MKKILVIGGGNYQVPIIKRIKELGFEALCVDINKNAQGFNVADNYKVIDVLDKEKCLEYAKENMVDAVMSFGATLPLYTVAFIGKKMNLPALSVETAKISTDKFLIKKRLAENGCNVLGDFFEISSLNDIKNKKFNFPCVIKPCDGSGSKGVIVLNDESNIEESIKESLACARYGRIYKEDLIDGKEYTVEAFVDNKIPYVYSVIKTTFEKDKNGKISYGHCTPSGLSAEDENLIVEEVKKAIFALDINMGSVNFDIILSKQDKKPYIIDCGIRIGQNLIGSHIVPFSRGVNVIDNTIYQALGEKINPNPKFKHCIATRLLIYRAGKIAEIKDFSSLIGKNGIKEIVLRKEVGDYQREYRDKSDTCGWVITEGKTPAEAEALAEKAKDALENYIKIEE